MIDVTPRDRIWFYIVRSDEIRFTTDKILSEVDDVSEHTVRDTLNAMSDAGYMTHKDSSPFWYVYPRYATM